uniref:Uncharacterized protein n=1 Tax=Engystomops pustulosus TaxID=76066 RepID=A0AAV6YRB1_ENGPU|nr:hypothetical protein GDO81_020333 [Engystomops pustulosus]
MAILDMCVSVGYLTYCRVQGSGQAHPLSQHPGPIGIWAPAFLHTPFTSDDTRATRDWNTCGSNFPTQNSPLRLQDSRWDPSVQPPSPSRQPHPCPWLVELPNCVCF